MKNHLFAPLYAGFVTLVLLILGQQGLNILLDDSNHKALASVTHTLAVEREATLFLKTILDEETASEIDINEKTAFHRSLKRLYYLEKNNPEQLLQLDRIQSIYDRWKSQLTEQVFSLSTTNHLSRKESLFNSLHTQVLVLLDGEEKLLSQSQHQLHQLHHINTYGNLLILITLLVVSGLNFVFLRQRIRDPLLQLTKAGKAWQPDRTEILFDYSSSNEIGQLAEVLNKMAREVHQRQQRIEMRNQQLEDLVCALSHDIRTPLIAARSTIKGMLKGAFGSIDSTWREVFEEYYESNEDLLKLMEAILDVSRYETNRGAHLNQDPLDWKRIFVKVTTQVKTTSKREFALTHKISASLPTVYGDEVEIRRVLQNLLDNAIRVSEPNKEIVLEVAALDKDIVRLSVCDRGSGISPQEQERLFHRFTQGRGRRGKAGLGLYLCRQIVEAHGGNIGVESTLDAGSTFWFTLPASADKATFPNENIYEAK